MRCAGGLFDVDIFRPDRKKTILTGVAAHRHFESMRTAAQKIRHSQEFRHESALRGFIELPGSSLLNDLAKAHDTDEIRHGQGLGLIMGYINGCNSQSL